MDIMDGFENYTLDSFDEPDFESESMFEPEPVPRRLAVTNPDPDSSSEAMSGASEAMDDTGADEPKSSAVVLGAVLKHLDGLCAVPAGVGSEAEKQEAGEGGAGAGSEKEGNEMNEGMNMPVQERHPLEYYRRRRDGLTEKQVGEWDELVAAMEALEITIDAQAKASPVTLLQNPGRLLKIIQSLNDLTIAAEAEAESESEKMSVVHSVCSGFNTPPANETEPFPTYSESRAREVAEHFDSPMKIPIRSLSGDGTSRRTPTPSAAIILGPDTYIGLTRHGVTIPGVHVHIDDVQFDGTNLIQWDGKLWLKLRVIRELEKSGGGSRPTPRPSPMFPSPMVPSPMVPPTMLPPFVQQGGGSQIRGAGLGLENLQGLPTGVRVEEHDWEAPTKIPILGDYFSIIGGGMLQGCYVSRKSGFLLGGIAWVKDLIVVPADI